MPNTEPVDIARMAAEQAAEKQAEDIVMLDIRKVCSFADYFVICNGTNQRQLQAILDDVGDVLQQAGAPKLKQEGTPESGWVLVDFGEVILHVFSPASREYYALDRLWRDGVEVLRFQ
ncbi:MAG: ribosome silencing factor [Dehalococcoidia bacterium]|nr:ribosome silencing factor [Dehalococcoidia bacterium]